MEGEKKKGKEKGRGSSRIMRKSKKLDLESVVAVVIPQAKIRSLARAPSGSRIKNYKI